VHNHAGKKRAALVVFAEIEIGHLQGKVASNVLQFSVFLELALIVLGPDLEVVEVRRIQYDFGQADGVANAGIGFVQRDVDDISNFLEFGYFLWLKQLRANQCAFLGDGKDEAIQMVEVRVCQADLDDLHIEVFLHPVVRLSFGSNAIASDIKVVIEMFEFGFPLEFGRRNPDLITHLMEEVDAYTGFATARLRSKVRPL